MFSEQFQRTIKLRVAGARRIGCMLVDYVNDSAMKEELCTTPLTILTNPFLSSNHHLLLQLLQTEQLAHPAGRGEEVNNLKAGLSLASSCRWVNTVVFLSFSPARVSFHIMTALTGDRDIDP